MLGCSLAVAKGRAGRTQAAAGAAVCSIPRGGTGDAEGAIRRRRAQGSTGGPIAREDVATLTRTADEYLAGHPNIAGVMVETRTFPGFASVGAFTDYARFIADRHARERRIALVTDSALAPVAEFMANHVVGVQMRHYSFAEGATALTWLRPP